MRAGRRPRQRRTTPTGTTPSSFGTDRRCCSARPTHCRRRSTRSRCCRPRRRTTPTGRTLTRENVVPSMLAGALHELPLKVNAFPLLSTATQNDVDGHDTEKRICPGSTGVGADHPLDPSAVEGPPSNPMIMPARTSGTPEPSQAPRLRPSPARPDCGYRLTNTPPRTPTTRRARRHKLQTRRRSLHHATLPSEPKH